MYFFILLITMTFARVHARITGNKASIVESAGICKADSFQVKSLLKDNRASSVIRQAIRATRQCPNVNPSLFMNLILAEDDICSTDQFLNHGLRPACLYKLKRAVASKSKTGEFRSRRALQYFASRVGEKAGVYRFVLQMRQMWLIKISPNCQNYRFGFEFWINDMFLVKHTEYRQTIKITDSNLNFGKMNVSGKAHGISPNC